MEYRFDRMNNVTLTEKEACDIVLRQFPNFQVRNINLDKSIYVVELGIPNDPMPWLGPKILVDGNTGRLSKFNPIQDKAMSTTLGGLING